MKLVRHQIETTAAPPKFALPASFEVKRLCLFMMDQQERAWLKKIDLRFGGMYSYRAVDKEINCFRLSFCFHLRFWVD
jgi:hypothetical protein